MEKKVASSIMLTLLLMGMLTLAFNIRSVKASGTIYIRADGSIDPPTAPISTVDDVTYTFTDNIYDSIVVERSNIIVDGAGYTLQGTGAYESKGISLSGRTNVTVWNTQIKAFYFGIRLDSSSSNSISGNNITANNWYGIWLASSSDNNSISGNNITNNDVGICPCFSSNNNSISGNKIAKGSYGIWIYYSSYNSISGNNITNNWEGIGLRSSSTNSISGNNIIDNYNGIGLSESSSNNSISENNVTNEDEGIHLEDSSYNSISGNNIANSSHGILISYYSSYNSISENNIANNYIGIWLDDSSNNEIYHNNFINNKGFQVLNHQSYNRWHDDYPSGGNYWSDYTIRYPNAQELDDSGIWDTPYVIDAYNRDYYPLMNPWTPPPPIVAATVDIDPDALNLRSKGHWITACIQLLEDDNPADIDASTILLNGTIQLVLDPKYGFVTNSSEYLVDHNGDGILERMVKFDRASVASWIYQSVGMQSAVSLTITGKLFDGTQFEGTDTVSVFWTGRRAPFKR